MERLRPSHPPRRYTLCVALAALLALAAVPAAAYVLVLKNGEQITAREKPQIRGGKAYFTLQNGTESFLDASELDLAKTEELNRDAQDLNARVIETRDVDAAPAEQDQKPTLRDLARQRSSLSRPEAARRDTPESLDRAALPKTRGGHVDLMQIPHRDFRETDVKTELLRFLRGQGVDQVAVYQGTDPKRVLVEMTTNTEASVFKGLKDTAGAFVQIRDLFPGKIAAIELLMATEARVRAGQFVLTPELAAELASGAATPESFFLRYVEF